MRNAPQKTPRERNSALLDPIEDVARGVARVGYGLFSLGLGLLPKQSRQHMQNAVRELSYGFASLPRDFAEIAGVEIERWAGAAPAEPTPRVQHITVVDETNSHAETQDMTRLSAAPAPPTPVTRVEASPAPPAPAAPAAPAVASEPKAAAPAVAPAAAPAAASEPKAAAPAAVPEPKAAAPAAAPEPKAAVPEPKAAAPAAAPKATAPAGINIVHLEYNATGRDRDVEYVLIRNSGLSSVDMTGWKLSDNGNRHTFTFPRFRLAPGAEVKLWSRPGNANAGNLYWGNRSTVWQSSGDTATLKDAAGAVVTSYSYQGKPKK
jgi:hypothetical protein